MQQNFDTPPIIGFIGKRGRGKTTTLVYHALKLALGLGQPIFSNFSLHYPKVETKFMNTKLLKTFFKKGGKALSLRDCILAIDELATFLDAYESVHTKKMRLFSLFAAQTRKKQVTFMYSQQTINRVPKPVRLLTDYMIFPHYHKQRDCLTYEVFEWNGTVFGQKRGTFIIQKVSQLFKYYDTNEVIDLVDDDDEII